MASRAKSRTLTDHDEIQRWAEERGAKPSMVGTTHGDEGTGIIRLDFPGYSGEGSLEEIGWDVWFENFDDNKLALVVQDQTAGGEQSNFNKLVSRRSAEQGATGRFGSRRRTAARTESRGRASNRTTGRSSRSSSKRVAARAKASSRTSGSGRSRTARKSSSSVRPSSSRSDKGEQTRSEHGRRSSGRKAA